MAWITQQYQDFALGVAVIFGAAILLGLARQAATNPRQFAARICGVMAGIFTCLALLWGAHLSDKWLP